MQDLNDCALTDLEQQDARAVTLYLDEQYGHLSSEALLPSLTDYFQAQLPKSPIKVFAATCWVHARGVTLASLLNDSALLGAINSSNVTFHKRRTVPNIKRKQHHITRIERNLGRPLQQVFKPWTSDPSLSTPFNLSVGTLSSIENVIALSAHLATDTVCQNLDREVNGVTAESNDQTDNARGQKPFAKHFTELCQKLETLAASTQDHSEEAFTPSERIFHPRLRRKLAKATPSLFQSPPRKRLRSLDKRRSKVNQDNGWNGPSIRPPQFRSGVVGSPRVDTEHSTDSDLSSPPATPLARARGVVSSANTDLDLLEQHHPPSTPKSTSECSHSSSDSSEIELGRHETKRLSDIAELSDEGFSLHQSHVSLNNDRTQDSTPSTNIAVGVPDLDPLEDDDPGCTLQDDADGNFVFEEVERDFSCIERKGLTLGYDQDDEGEQGEDGEEEEGDKENEEISILELEEDPIVDEGDEDNNYFKGELSKHSSGTNSSSADTNEIKRNHPSKALLIRALAPRNLLTPPSSRSSSINSSSHCCKIDTGSSMTDSGSNTSALEDQLKAYIASIDTQQQQQLQDPSSPTLVTKSWSIYVWKQSAYATANKELIVAAQAATAARTPMFPVNPPSTLAEMDHLKGEKEWAELDQLWCDAVAKLEAAKREVKEARKEFIRIKGEEERRAESAELARQLLRNICSSSSSCS